MSARRPPHPDPTLSSRTAQEPEKFRLVTDEAGRTSLVHQGMNRAQRQRAKAEQKKALKKAIVRLQRLAASARKKLASGQAPDDGLGAEPPEGS